MEAKVLDGIKDKNHKETVVEAAILWMQHWLEWNFTNFNDLVLVLLTPSASL